jgi:hypothetical protein
MTFFSKVLFRMSTKRKAARLFPSQETIMCWNLRLGYKTTAQTTWRLGQD